MAFNHYAKIKRILQSETAGWYIKRINQPTTSKSFSGEVKRYDHYYRIYNKLDQPIKFCKFQQIERLAKTLQIPSEDLMIID